MRKIIPQKSKFLATRCPAQTHQTLATAEMVRMDPSSTKNQFKEQTQILHHIKDMVSSLDGIVRDGL